jgi:sugar phosphate isomerase/epimerase
MKPSPGRLQTGNTVSAALLWISMTVGTTIAGEPPHRFFAFDNGVGRGNWTPEQQAECLEELGYAGIGYTGTTDLEERARAMSARGLKIYSLYLHCFPAQEDPYPPHLEQTVRMLAGTQTMLWLTVQGETRDEDAVRVIRHIADRAQEHQVNIALYPHFGFYVATARDAARLVKKVDRANVGVSINLCHELRAGNETELEDILREVAPHLFLVSVNGAEKSGGWDQLIQTLDQGAFDVSGFLGQLKQAGYRGPIGLQCYNIKGDPRENLAASMRAWKRLTKGAPTP